MKSPKKPGFFFEGALVILCLIFQACGGRYGSLGNPEDSVPFTENLRRGTLPSGLSYYILENKKPENRAYLRLAVKAGSVLEADNEQGIAHFVEHLAFENTENFPNQELIAYLRSLGMRYGADVNAATNFDFTYYDIEVPVVEASSPETPLTEGAPPEAPVKEYTAAKGNAKIIPRKAFAIIDDWSHNVLFRQDGINKERNVILEEERARSGAGQRLWKELSSLVLEGSRYAGRLPIGKPEVIKNADAALLEGFYNRWYTADKMAVIIVGDFDAEQTEKKLAEYFTIEAPAQKTGLPEYPLPPPDKGSRRAKVFIDNELKNTSIEIYYRMNYKPPEGSLENYRQDLIDLIIYKILRERFSDAGQKADTPYFSADARQTRFARSALHYYLGAAAKQGQFKESLRELLKLKESVVRYGFTASEIERAVRDILSEAETAALEKDKMDSYDYISIFTNNFFRNIYASDFEWDLKAARILLPLISAEEIHNAAKDYFKEDDVLVFVSANDSGELLSEDEIVDMIAAVSNEDIEKPSADVIEGSLIKELPPKGKIVKEERDRETRTVVLTLSNGAKVLLKPTENQNDEVRLVAEARGGISGADPDDIVSARIADEAAQASGLGEFKLSELGKKLSGKQVSVSFNNSTWTRTVEGSTRVADQKTFFELLYLGFTAPRIDEDIISILKDEYRTALANRENNPESYFSDELAKILYDNNPYLVVFKLSDIEKIDIERARNFIARTRNPADYTFVFTGNINEGRIKKLIETYLASIPAGSKENFNEWKALDINFPGTVNKKLFKGRENKSIVYLGYSVHDNFSFEGSLTADLLEGYLEIVLNDEVREKLTGVYSISPYVSLSLFPQGRELTLSVYFVCNPERSGELSDAVKAVLSGMAGGTINGDAFEKARLAALNSADDALQSNTYIASRFASYSVVLDIPLSDLYRKKEVYRNVRISEVQEMTQKLLAGRPVHVVLYPKE